MPSCSPCGPGLLQERHMAVVGALLAEPPPALLAPPAVFDPAAAAAPLGAQQPR